MPIATRDSYVGYKQDTQRLLEWMWKTTKLILKTRPAGDGGSGLPWGVSPSGETNVAGLVSMASLIADHGAPVSSSIYRLLMSIIRARSSHYAAFMDYASIFPDQEIEKSNSMHRHFIDSLMEIFSILGGISWWDKQMEANDLASKRSTSEPPASKRSNSDSEQIEEIKGVIFSNKFASLNFADDGPSEPQQEAESESEVSEAEINYRKKTSNKNKKKGKGKKGKKTPKAQKTEVKRRAKVDSDLDEISAKSYRILEDNGDLMTNYTMAILSITAELSQMRHYLMNLWHEVASEGLNTAVAGAVSHVAIAKVKKTEEEVFTDFPGYECYESITTTLTKGDIDRFQQLSEAKATAKPLKDCPNCEVDVREKLLLYAYQDLVDFVTDFQMNRNGKPTKAMRKRLGNWDPNFCLEDATKEERIKWRRVYTINYLYDLVNEYTAIEQKKRGSNRCFSEPIDWSPEGPTGAERRLLGMTEFAAFVTSLVTQETSVDFRRTILPRHVFQLQCIVDATMIAQFGWMLCPHGTHSFAAPCGCRTPMGEIDRFLLNYHRKGCAGEGEECKCPSDGYLSASEELENLLHAFSDPRYATRSDSEYQYLIEKTIDWAAGHVGGRLGRSPTEVESAPTPPSRFSHLGPNALWRYSYFLCGVGLAEALQIAYTAGMRLLDLLPEPTMMAHIELLLSSHNYFDGEEYGGLPIAQQMRAQFHRAVFGEQGAMPHWLSDVHELLEDFDAWASSGSAVRDGRITRAQASRPGVLSLPAPGSVLSVFPLRQNVDFNIPSQIFLYQEAGWDPSKIPGRDIHPRSALAAIRLSRTPMRLNTETGEHQLEFTELAKQLSNANGRDKQAPSQNRYLEAGMKQTLASIAMLKRNRAPRGADEELSKDSFGKLETILEDLEAAKIDIWDDIGGLRPLSSINFPLLVNSLYRVFVEAENTLFREGNKFFMDTYMGPKQTSLIEMRYNLARRAMTDEDPGVMKAFTEAVKSQSSEWTDYLYYKETRDPLLKSIYRAGVEVPEDFYGCTVM